MEKALELLKIFSENEYDAYIVGGFVRDHILGRPSSDVDICTNATPKQVQEIFKDVKLPFEQYGSVHLIYKKVNFEITTYRMDLEYHNARRPSKIMYTDKLDIDLKRRDFTMNTLCMGIDGKIINLFGGLADIDDRIIRTVGDPEKRLKEDSLRILRAVRFATELNFKIDKHLERAIINNRAQIKDLSYYRKKQELNRIFASSNANLGIELLKEYGLDFYLGIDLNKEVVNTNDPLGIWAQINPNEGYQFTSNEKDYLKAILRVLRDDGINDIELYREGNYVCYIAAQILKINAVDMYDRFDRLSIKKASDIAINGRQIIDHLKLEDQSKVKNIIRDLEELIISGKIANELTVIKKFLDVKYGNR